MPRDILSDSLAVLRIVEHEDEENWQLEDKASCKQTKTVKSACDKIASDQSYIKDECCYYNYIVGEGATNRQCDPVYQFKTNSLPAASSMSQSWDTMVCSVLRIAPEDIANQLSLLDLLCFKSIKPEELTTCGWTKLNKLMVAPNVVAFTKRFNRVSFWTVQEILNGQSPKVRAETLAHFIKVAKKLYDLNNLHSLFAVISALTSASIYRLTKTWACLSKKDKQQFDKLAELFGDKDNWMTLREYMRSISLPCIPYLGIFLTDLVYIDIAHPSGSPHRVAKMAVVLKALERYQTSEYTITPVPHVANYLNSVRYIEELQKFLEDDQYKLSLKLEPPSPIGSCAGSKESVKEVQGPSTPFTLSPSHRLGSGSLRLQGSYTQAKFIPTHRKCRSLGSNIFGKSHSEDKDERTPAGSVNLLDDTLLESPSWPTAGAKTSKPLPFSDGSSVMDSVECEFQSYVRRKTIIKDGRKISLSSWQRYWLQISGNVLIFYSSKTFKGTSRNDFSKERCKVVELHDGWRAALMDCEAQDAFQLVDHRTGTIYKFKTGNDSTAKQWAARINDVTNKLVTPLPANLMSFE
ncbi:ras-specific guanine nucleotide-releasing factor RalGPS1-like isoform X1 [Danaus plexippus]|uniref:Ral guanine nucleotide exchange factor n=1 Tax=Danaus plexippus plexippus TaxID=278856 RepID=A0A212FHJ2_DANPL|nr:ras-specific guanine nucleotide-releasing factor RalGPS1-like isoform X1 [Danaus plexippus]XP_061382273.1 ras-specific guanine nucleotide-releasing factor RalGPS1-like isoform X1 [Danaus plexippus]XP_061382274.1 ras-specific guanine nucleotide-releasing factor RalGPS1-like isoform X1 [Danaus plexippus]XP_061382275.1 ras-specific guanine nucleotide-releasing factor RalGPS1-like isoform X1 [Danaus plexippus]OWR53177.1 putative Ral guanine nucleotide exchange factor [Danaus plexippus plexippus]